jgi:aminoglycoside phosphotransferase family enzyme
VPLKVGATGQLHLGNYEPGESSKVVDWLVKMRRLPANGMLDQAISQGVVRETELRQAGTLLARFYHNAPPVSISPQDYRHRIEEDLQGTLQELEKPDYHLPSEQVKAMIAEQLEILRTEPALFDRRVNGQRIVEGHGDLRPQHICLSPEVAIIDCLEFNPMLRIVDPVDELAFLGLECERLGAAWIEEVMFAVYRDVTQDNPPLALIRFYKTYRACLRAKLAVWHIQAPGRNGHNHWLQLAQTYLQLGQQYLG